MKWENQDDFITQLSELLNVKYSRGVEIEDAIIQQIQTLQGSRNLKISKRTRSWYFKRQY